MPKYALHSLALVPHLDKGGTITAITGKDENPVYTIDFGHGETQDFTEAAVAPHGI
jgi:hypothetical protein